MKRGRRDNGHTPPEHRQRGPPARRRLPAPPAATGAPRVERREGGSVVGCCGQRCSGCKVWREATRPEKPHTPGRIGPGHRPLFYLAIKNKNCYRQTYVLRREEI